MPARYPGFSWFFRAARVLPMVAFAALVGGVIGGFSVFAINLALTSPPSSNVQVSAKQANETNVAKAAAATAVNTPLVAPVSRQASAQSVVPNTAAPNPVRTVDAPGPASVGVTPPVPQTQTAATPSEPQPAAPPVQPQQASSEQAPWPDALTRAQPTSPAPATPAEHEAATPSAKPAQAEPAQAASTPAAESVQTTTAQNQPVAPQSAAAVESEHKTLPKRRAVAQKPLQLTPDQSASNASPRSARPVYDYYGRSDQRVVRLPDGTVVVERGRGDLRARSDRPHYVVRRQGPDEDADNDTARALPPQPAPPRPFFFGLFGGGDRYDDQ